MQNEKEALVAIYEGQLREMQRSHEGQLAAVNEQLATALKDAALDHAEELAAVKEAAEKISAAFATLQQQNGESAPPCPFSPLLLRFNCYNVCLFTMHL